MLAVKSRVHSLGRAENRTIEGTAPRRLMLPLHDNVPTRTFPVVTVALIAINVAVWLFYQLPNLDRSVHDLAFHPCEVNGSCASDRQGLAR